MNSSPYLFKRSDSTYYWVKKRIPSDLLGHSELLAATGRPKEFLQESTKTADKKLATKRSVLLVSKWDEMFSRLRCALDGEGGSGRCSDEIPYPLDAYYPEEEAVRKELLADRAIALDMLRGLDTGRLEAQNILSGFDEIKKELNPKFDPSMFDSALFSIVKKYSSIEGLHEAWVKELSDLAGDGVTPSSQLNAVRLADWMVSPSTVTIGEVIGHYLKKRYAEASRVSHVKTQEKVIQLFVDSCLPMKSRTPICSVSGSHAVEFVSVVSDRWESDTTRKNKISNISAVFDYAMKAMKAIDSNPFANIYSHIPKIKGVGKTSKNLAFTEEQLPKLLQNLYEFSANAKASSSAYLFPAAIIALYTGMRIEEVSRIEVSDVFSHAESCFLKIDEAKTDAGVRSIPLNKGAKMAVDWLVGQKLDVDDPWLFEGLTIYESRRSKKLSSNFSKWKSGQKFLNGEHTFHSFRSTVATKLDNEDVSGEYIGLILGHEDARGALSLKVYSTGKALLKLVPVAEKIDYGSELLEQCRVDLSKISSKADAWEELVVPVS